VKKENGARFMVPEVSTVETQAIGLLISSCNRTVELSGAANVWLKADLAHSIASVGCYPTF
jgi:hypothetical protein